MVRNKSKLFSSPVPHIQAKGGSYQPDLLVAIKDGKIKVAHLSESATLYKVIRQMDNLLDELKDLKWMQDQRLLKTSPKKKIQTIK